MKLPEKEAKTVSSTQASEGCAPATGDGRIRQAIMRMFGCSGQGVRHVAVKPYRSRTIITKPPTGEFKSRLKPDRLDEIILIARALLVERGFDAFTLDEVALRARCSKRLCTAGGATSPIFIVDVIGREIPTTEPNTDRCA